MTDAIAAPDERALRAHLDSGRFQAGVEAGRFRLVSIDWPIVIVMISAAPREGAPSEYALRFELSGYPNIAPTGGVWDLDADTTLAADKRPKGDRLSMVFRFEGGGCGPTAMYAPWDCMGLNAHREWAQSARHLAWHPGRDLTFILDNVHGLLAADDYLGI